MADVVSGVQWVHGRGMVHMDLKPGNIMAARHPGRRITLKITDFGLAGCDNSTIQYCNMLLSDLIVWRFAIHGPKQCHVGN